MSGCEALADYIADIFQAKGWHVLRVWEHELRRQNQARLIGRIRRAMEAGELNRGLRG